MTRSFMYAKRLFIPSHDCPFVVLLFNTDVSRIDTNTSRGFKHRMNDVVWPGGAMRLVPTYFEGDFIYIGFTGKVIGYRLV